MIVHLFPPARPQTLLTFHTCGLFVALSVRRFRPMLPAR